MATEHKWGNPCTRADDSHNGGCMWCDGGLEVCSECGAFEGATPDECPGTPMPAALSDAVYAGSINFRDGEWRAECCKVMRPVHDLHNFMNEQGYYAEGRNAAGHVKWVKRHE